jgi:hypothetical protein
MTHKLEADPGQADPREACYSHIRVLPWTGGGGGEGNGASG